MAAKKSTQPAPSGPVPTSSVPDLPMPHERDESQGHVDDEPREVMRQAKRDIDAGLVDTDMRATPGLDSERREQLVPTPRAPRKGR
jgi:hypothetical protein